MADAEHSNSRCERRHSDNQEGESSQKVLADVGLDSKNAGTRPGLVHVFNQGGHRAMYQTFLASKLGLMPVAGPIRWPLAIRLIRAEQLLFATISRRTSFNAILIAFLRACIGKRTSAICMEEKWYQNTDRRFRSAISFNLFKLLNAVSRLKVYSVIPHKLMPELTKSTSGWILDLCLWDLLDQQESMLDLVTELSERVRKVASGRKVVLFLGKASRRKGFDDLASLANAIGDRALIVSAGRVAQECSGSAESLRRMGMFVEDRLVSEDELISLYSVADYVWCRYDESSGSLSSGVFGRAVQLQKKTVVRRGSYLHRLAKLLDQSPVHDLEAELSEGQRYGNGSPQANTNPIGKSQSALLKSMAQKSIDNLRNSL